MQFCVHVKCQAFDAFVLVFSIVGQKKKNYFSHFNVDKGNSGLFVVCAINENFFLPFSRLTLLHFNAHFGHVFAGHNTGSEIILRPMADILIFH